ncbi:MAG: ATP synthase F1 subunit delta [Planctomycetota bacterium]
MSDPQQHSTVLDIGAEQLGKPYARALISAAAKEGVADQVMGDLSAIVDEGLKSNPRLEAAFASPRVSESEKDRVIDQVFGGKVHPILIRGMKVMNSHGRLGYLSAVRDAAAKILDEQLGRVVAEVRTAVPLPDDLREEVKAQVGRSLGKEVRLQESIDEDLIGGMVIRVGDTVFDSSVSGRLEKLGRSVRTGFANQLLERAGQFVSDHQVSDAVSSDSTQSDS